MKLKAAIAKESPDVLRRALESEAFYNRVIREVLQKHLHVPFDFGPAEFYIQECDVTVGRKELMCEARLTGVSWRKDRDFVAAQADLDRIYAEAIRSSLPEGDRLQLFVVVMTDTPGGNDSPFYEGNGAHWVMDEMTQTVNPVDKHKIQRGN